MSPRIGAAAVLAALLLGGASGAGIAACGDDDGGRSDGNALSQRGDGDETTTTRVEVLETVAPGQTFDPQGIYEREGAGVVTVYSVFSGGGLDSLLGGGGGGGGVGSGFVVSGDGEIATNAHVVTQGEAPGLRRAREVYVEFTDGNQVEAEIVGHDPYADIALLRVDPEGLTLRPLPLGSSDDIRVGEPVVAIGSPFGERNSLSVGVVSAVDRSIASLTQFQISGAIQTDAAINPGNSGGPLVNARGEVVGVNQQIRTNSGGGEGVGYAVPVDAVRRSLDQLREDGEVAYAYLGVATIGVYPQLAERFDLPVEQGVWVQTVNPGGPADRAGLRAGGDPQIFQARTVRPGGDVITRVDRTPIRDASDLSVTIAERRPGERVALEIYRDGERDTVEVTLGERPLDDPDARP